MHYELCIMNYSVSRIEVIFINVALIILAAGLSERMGVFKPLLPVGENTAVERCMRAAEAAGISRIIVVTGHMRAELESVLHVSALDVERVHNNRFRDGMFSSVYAGVLALHGVTGGLDGFFLLPADCCAITPAIFTLLMERFAENNGEYVTRPKYQGRRGHPPLIPGKFISPLLSYTGENGLKGFLSPLPTIEIEMDDKSALLDMDTPEDYAELLEFLGLPAYPSPAQCSELFAKYGTPMGIMEHGKQVAALALNVARQMNAHGEDIDVNLLGAACLLHDICREKLNHARAGMEMLLREGYPTVAALVALHMDMQGFKQDIREAELLFLSDKLCRRGEIIALEDTLAELEERFSENPNALKAAKERIETAKAIFDTLKTKYGAAVLEAGIMGQVTSNK